MDRNLKEEIPKMTSRGCSIKTPSDIDKKSRIESPHG